MNPGVLHPFLGRGSGDLVDSKARTRISAPLRGSGQGGMPHGFSLQGRCRIHGLKGATRSFGRGHLKIPRAPPEGILPAMCGKTPTAP